MKGLLPVGNRARQAPPGLYEKNVQMLLLCGLTSFWLLASPLIPYTFAVTTVAGLALFLALQLVLTSSLGALGIALNHLAAHEEPVTRQAVLRALRRALEG